MAMKGVTVEDAAWKGGSLQNGGGGGGAETQARMWDVKKLN